MVSAAEITKRFSNHKMDAEQLARVEGLSSDFLVLAKYVVDAVPPGREQAIVLTHLEQAKFMAVAGIARMHINVESDD